MALEGLSLAEQLHLAKLYGIETEYVPGQDDEGLPEDYFDNLNAADTVLNQAPTSVTQPITEVTEEGILGGQAGGLLDRGIQILSPQYQALRAVQGYFDERYEAGTPTETIKNISNWWDDVELPEWMTGLVAQNVPTGSGLFGESTDMGSFGTAEGLGGVSNSIEDDMAVSDY